MPTTRDFIHGPWRAVLVLGVTQILAWGAIFYPPVLTLPLIAADRGWSTTFVRRGINQSDVHCIFTMALRRNGCSPAFRLVQQLCPVEWSSSMQRLVMPVLITAFTFTTAVAGPINLSPLAGAQSEAGLP